MRTLSNLLRATFAVLLSAAATVHARPAADLPVGTVVPPIDGYVWASQPAADYVAGATYAHNSAGGNVQVHRSGTGAYQVRFAGMAGTGGVAHTVAYGGTGFCNVTSWIPSSGDELINIRCFAANGALADSKFVADVTNRDDGAANGYLWSNDPTPPAAGYAPPATWSHDSTGQPIVVSSSGTGHYDVALGAYEQDSPSERVSGALRVTPYGSSAVTCQVADPALFTDPEVIRVRCFDTAGYVANTRFALSYTRGVVPVSATVDNYGPAPAVSGWSSPSGLPPTASRLGDGDYLISFPGAGTAGGHAFANIMATPPMYCVVEWWTQNLGALLIRTRCYAPGSGAPNTAVLFTVGFYT